MAKKSKPIAARRIKPTAPIQKASVGVKYESAKFGCYDKRMNPHPTWKIPAQVEVMMPLSRAKALKNVRIVKYIGSRPEVARDENGRKIKNSQGKEVKIEKMVFTATYHPYPDFIIPTDIMSNDISSAKLKKNERPSMVLYMSPVARNSFGLNTCPAASDACAAVCLDYSGQKVGQQKQRAAIARTDMYFAHRDLFWSRIYQEIQDFRKANLKMGFKEIAIRLNGTSDLPLFTEFATWCANNQMPIQKDIVFYDYTKVLNQVTFPKGATRNGKQLLTEYQNPLGARHKVTFSLSEAAWKDSGKSSYRMAAEVLLSGGTIAAVFLVDPRGAKEPTKNKQVRIESAGEVSYYAPLPKFLTFEYEGKLHKFPILDGDASDDLMLEPKASGAVLGLRAKLRAQHDRSGFALPVFALRNAGEENEELEDVYIELDVNKRVINEACGLKQAEETRFQCEERYLKDPDFVMLDDEHLFRDDIRFK